jgi:hypothetical protein
MSLGDLIDVVRERWCFERERNLKHEENWRLDGVFALRRVV